MRVIVLAAGQGKRLGTLNNGYPKCLLKINGETLIERLLNQFSLLKIDDITIVVGY
ncbi:uncharacterized protein METZ01_LOCUS508210 [marine metagenome]|uniref:MobA-like NTP transferase domain-containing protein n=1 Tax=marine metagenome TaxID=408172 RepID=A0A383EES7_9ZZZZ